MSTWSSIPPGFVVCPLAWAMPAWHHTVYQAALAIVAPPSPCVWTLDRLAPSLN